MNNDMVAKFLLNRIASESDIEKAKALSEKLKNTDEALYHIALSYVAEKENDMKKAQSEANTAYEIANEHGERVVVKNAMLLFGVEKEITNNRTILDRYADVSFRMERYRDAVYVYDFLHALYPGNRLYFYRFIYSLSKTNRESMAADLMAEYIATATNVSKNTIILYAEILDAAKRTGEAEKMLANVRWLIPIKTYR